MLEEELTDHGPALSRRSLLSLGAAAFAFPIPAWGDSADQVLRQKLVIAGRQRMLTQRIARAALFRSLDIEAGQHKRMLKQAHGQFERALMALSEGDDDLGLSAETNDLVAGRLADVAALWQSFGPVAERLISPKTEQPGDQAAVLGENLALLQASDAVVKGLLQEYGNKDTEIGLAIAIDVAARQRMLTQKMAKEVAIVVIAQDIAAAQAQLARTVEIFDGALKALMEGLPTITLPPPPPQIHAKLEEVQALWLRYSEVIRFVYETGIASQYELAAVTAQTDDLLTTMNEAVQMYQNS